MRVQPSSVVAGVGTSGLDVDDPMEVMVEETFGPVMTVVSTRDLDEGIERASSVRTLLLANVAAMP
jgi:acyl-CoA reductase-like NAD-dependent aldehyde dehydrogenase